MACAAPPPSRTSSWNSSAFESVGADVMSWGGSQVAPAPQDDELALPPADAEDSDSMASVESQWLLVGEEEALSIGEAEEDLGSTEEEEGRPRAGAGEEAEAGPPPEPLGPGPAAKAELLAAAPVRLGSPWLVDCEGFRGEVTHQWAAAFEHFPSIAGAYCLGRVLVAPPAKASGVQGLEVVARAALRNGGSAAWPVGTSLRIVAGDSYGFDAMHIGPIEPGHGADLTLDLVLPTADEQPGKRSAWVLADDCGCPFGPILVLEVIWTEL